jgi:hypothetical protein
MRNALKNVISALYQLERTLRKDEPLRREAGAIREAFQARSTALATLRKMNPKVKPKPMNIELCIPSVGEVEAFSVELDVSSARGLQSWDWWRRVWNGTA